MVNLLHICEKMTTRWYAEEEIRVPIDSLKKFAEKNNLELKRRLAKNKVKYKMVRHAIPVHFISGEEESNIKILDISDIHIGNPNFDEEAFKGVLKQALDINVSAVFIAGDIFEGTTSDVADDNVIQVHIAQVDKAFELFKQFPLKYYVINGNHDYTFEQIGLANPVKMLASKLLNAGIEFHFFDTYVMDFIISGVVKRVMHVERQDFTKKKIFAVEKLRQFEKELGLIVYYGGIEYPIRLFQAGHIHINVQMYYARRKIFISQSGSFLKNDETEERANFITAKVIDKKVFMC